MEARVPHQQAPQPNPPQDVTDSKRVEQVPGASPIQESLMRSQPIGAGNEPAPPTLKDIPKNRGRRVYMVAGIIIASLFAILLVWMFVGAGKELVEEQPIPLEVPE